jgi:hypothetical protein
VTAGVQDKTISTWLSRARREERLEHLLWALSALLIVAVVGTCATLTVTWVIR